MDYQYQYDQLILKSKNNEHIIREGYYEKHHILPKCMGGDNSPSNIVCLTAKAHFVAHHLLCKQYPSNNKLAYAFHLMCFHNSSDRGKLLNSRLFKKARTHYRKFHPSSNSRKPSKIVREYRCHQCQTELNTRNKFCDKTCHDDWQRKNFNRSKESHDKMVTSIRSYFETIDPIKKQKWLENSVHSDKVDHVERGRKISESKKGKSTNQYEIMGKRVAVMDDIEFDSYLKTLKPRAHKKFINLRNKWKKILQSEN